MLLKNIYQTRPQERTDNYELCALRIQRAQFYYAQGHEGLLFFSRVLFFSRLFRKEATT